MPTKRWKIKPEANAQKVASLSAAINVNPYLSGILVQRGIEEFEQAKTYFRPSLNDLHDPFLMKGVKEGVARINAAVEEGE